MATPSLVTKLGHQSLEIRFKSIAGIAQPSVKSEECIQEFFTSMLAIDKFNIVFPYMVLFFVMTTIESMQAITISQCVYFWMNVPFPTTKNLWIW